MARPSAKVKHSIEVGDNTWEILEADKFYVITYKELPANIRITQATMTQGNIHIYKKLTYTNLGSANLQCQRLNYRFKCNDFKVMEVGN